MYKIYENVISIVIIKGTIKVITYDIMSLSMKGDYCNENSERSDTR